MKFEEWWEKKYGNHVFVNRSDTELSKHMCEQSWNAGFEEGKKFGCGLGIEAVCEKDEPAPTEPETQGPMDIPVTEEQREQIIELFKLPYRERLKRIGLETEEIKTPHGTLTLIKNKYFDGHLGK